MTIRMTSNGTVLKLAYPTQPEIGEELEPFLDIKGPLEIVSVEGVVPRTIAEEMRRMVNRYNDTVKVSRRAASGAA